MENASKALIIAGGMLLAIITLSLIVYMTTATGRIGEAQDAKTALEQLTAFNMQYEAYNKQVMYGTEVITVINKAIDYNKKLKPIDAEDDIKITIDLKENFYATERTDTTWPNGRTDYGDEVTIGETSLERGNYTVGYNAPSNLISFFKQNPEDSSDTTNYRTKVETVYYHSALTNFRRAIFKCTNVDYNQTTGRIDSMTFEQRLINN